MLTIHHLDNSRSQRILWLAEELGLDYEIVKHRRDPKTLRAPASLAKVHPLGKAPLIEHEGRVVAESGAISEYLTRKLAGGRLSVPPESPDFGAYLEWLHFPEGSVQGPLVFDLIHQWTGGGNDALQGFYDAELERHQRYMEAVFADREFVVGGSFTAADVNLAWTLEMAEARGRMDACPRLRDYVARMQARPAYARALERGGPQELGVFGRG